MKILSVNVGRPRPITWEGRVALSGIFKQSVDGPVQVKTLNLDGDQQADLSVHGGVNKAVYAYPSEHYAFWQSLYPSRRLDWGAFGENLTTEGLLETAAGVGDTLRVGTVILKVIQPRLPCYKLAARFQDIGILQQFTESGRSGIYFSVEKEGQLQAGASAEWIYRQPGAFTIADAMRLFNGENVPLDKLESALKVKGLPDSWRDRIEASFTKNTL
jgi:MOSC domain-containing protein YiiM